MRSGNAKIMEGLLDQIFDAFCVMAVNALKTKNDVNDVSYSTSEALDATMHDYDGYVTMADSSWTEISVCLRQHCRLNFLVLLEKEIAKFVSRNQNLGD